jgi:hypothetical protein
MTHVLTLTGPLARAAATRRIHEAPDGYVVTIKEPNRSTAQNSAMWPILEAFAEQLEWPVNGVMTRIAAEDWKDILTCAFRREQPRVAMGIDGGMVQVLHQNWSESVEDQNESESIPMTEPKTSDVVLEAIQDLHASEHLATREALTEITGMKLSIIDDRLTHLVNTGQVIRRQRGVFEPAMTHPAARAISKTILPDGLVKIEIGDEVLTLTPREDRYLSNLMAGARQQFASIEFDRMIESNLSSLAGKVRRMEEKLQRQQGKSAPKDSLPEL